MTEKRHTRSQPTIILWAFPHVSPFTGRHKFFVVCVDLGAMGCCITIVELRFEFEYQPYSTHINVHPRLQLQFESGGEKGRV